MLVLSRRIGEKIVVGDNITIVVNRISGNRVSLGIDAPDDVSIVRGELEPIVKSFELGVDSALPIDVQGDHSGDVFLSAS